MHNGLRRWIQSLFVLSTLLLPLGLAAQALLDINTATAEQLEALPGIGPAKAQAILEYREAHGPFGSVEELNDVSGIGDATMAQLRPLVTVGAGASETPPRADVPTDDPDPIDLTDDPGTSRGDRDPDEDSLEPPTTDESPEVPSGDTASGTRVNINTADQATLETLPGIGAGKARAIIQYREQHGPFPTVDALDDVEGIGPSTMATLRDLITVE